MRGEMACWRNGVRCPEWGEIACNAWRDGVKFTKQGAKVGNGQWKDNRAMARRIESTCTFTRQHLRSVSAKLQFIINHDHAKCINTKYINRTRRKNRFTSPSEPSAASSLEGNLYSQLLERRLFAFHRNIGLTARPNSQIFLLKALPLWAILVIFGRSSLLLFA